MYWRLADAGVPVRHLLDATATHADYVTSWRPRPVHSNPTVRISGLHRGAWGLTPDPKAQLLQVDSSTFSSTLTLV